MWSLIPVADAGGERLRMLVGKKYTLGRTAADFTINNDKSISRTHALLEVTHPGTNISHPHKPSLFTVRDVSRFGTVVQDKKITNYEQLVNSGDTIKFGTVNSIYRAVYEPYVVTTSCLDQEAKQSTKMLVTRLGGHVVGDWRRQCQLLVMSSIRISVKVICALVALKPIVTISYLEKLVECIEATTPIPNPEDYTPPLVESQLNPHEVSFKVDERRKTLFTGKTFIFLIPKQFKKLNVAVELAGGTPMLMEEGTDDNEDDILVEQTTRVMYADPTNSPKQMSQNAHEWVKHVFQVLKKHGRRPILDAELGFAILYCTTDRYCDPRMEAAPSQNTQSNIPLQLASQQVTPPSLSPVMPLPSQHQGAQTVTQPPAPSIAKSMAKTISPALVDSKPQVVVKEELISPSKPTVTPSQLPSTPPRAKKPGTTSGTPPITKFFSKKRQREDDDDEEGSTSTSKVPRIKEEVQEVKLSNQRSPSPCKEASTTTCRRAQFQRSVSPEMPAQSPSLSPPPHSNRAPSHVAPPPSPTIPQRRSPRSRSPSPTPSRARTTWRSPSLAATGRVSPKLEPPEQDEVDDFDTFKPRARQRKQHNVDTSSTSCAKDKSSVRIKDKSDDNTESMQHRTDLKRSHVTPKTEIPEPLPQKKQMNENVDVNAASSPVPKSDSALREARRAPSPLPNGFLTTHQTTRVQDDGSGDAGHGNDLPSNGGMVIVMARLTVPQRQCPSSVAENNNTINGKEVKNFKKFKKVMVVGGRRLPRILGGADLRPHLNNPREIDAWFEEERQTQKARETQEQEADDMFNWQPSKVTKKKPTRRR